MKQPIRCAHVDDAVDRLLAGAVPPDEDALLREHAEACDSCDALLARLDGLVEGPPAPPEPDDLSRRRGFLAMEARLRETPPRIGWRPVAIAAAAVLVALSVGLAVGANRTAPAARIASVETVPEGVRWTAPPGGSATFDLGGGTRIVMSEGATARVLGIDGPTLELQLAGGLLVGELTHEGSVRRIVVTAPRGRVEVTGTKFAVRATRDDDVVAVKEGVVQVVAGRRHSDVRAGQARSLETLELVDAGALASIWALLGEEVQTSAAAASATTSAPVATAAEPLSAVVARSAPPAAREATSAPAVDPLAELRRRAESGTDVNAMFDLGTELMRSDPAGAARWFNRYQAHHGPASREALHNEMRLMEQTGRHDRAKALAIQYIGKYPNAITDEARRIAGQ